MPEEKRKNTERKKERKGKKKKEKGKNTWTTVRHQDQDKMIK